MSVLGIELGSLAGMACPYCTSEVGLEVSAGIFNDDFGANLALMVLPFAIMVIVVALIHFGGPGRGPAHGAALGSSEGRGR